MFHTQPQFLDLTPEMKEKLDRFAAEHDGEEPGPVANHVLYEDDKVRIWEMKLEPGEHSALHSHDLDYYLVILSGDLVAAVMPKASGMDSFVGIIPSSGNTGRFGTHPSDPGKSGGERRQVHQKRSRNDASGMPG